METVEIFDKSEYGPIRTNEYQQSVIDRLCHKNIISSDEFRSKVMDVPEELFFRIKRLIKYAQWKPEASNSQGYEDYVCLLSKGKYPYSEIVTNIFRFQFVGEYLKRIVEDWVQQPLIMEFCFGPRQYKEGSLLINHVDIKNYIVSVTLTIDYDLNEPWPLTCELEDKVLEINLKPGQMLLYEGRSTPHARPYPMNGKYYTNMYAHYYPAV